MACGAANARRLGQHAYRGLGPRCGELRGSCGGRAVEEGQVDQGARAHRPLSSFTDSFSPLIIRSSFLTSPPAAQKEALNGCTLGGGDSQDNAPGGEIEGSILGNLGSADSKIVLFAACGASFGPNWAGQYHQLHTGLLLGLKSTPVTSSMLSLRLRRGSLASGRTFFSEDRALKARGFIAKTACSPDA